MKVCKTLTRRFDSDPRLHSKHSQLAEESATYGCLADFTAHHHIHLSFTPSGYPIRQKVGKEPQVAHA